MKTRKSILTALLMIMLMLGSILCISLADNQARADDPVPKYEVLAGFLSSDYNDANPASVTTDTGGENYRSLAINKNSISVNANNFAGKVIKAYYYLTVSDGYNDLVLSLEYDKDVFEYVAMGTKEGVSGVSIADTDTNPVVTVHSEEKTSNTGSADYLFWVQYKVKYNVPAGTYQLGIKATTVSGTTYSGSYAKYKDGETNKFEQVSFVGGQVTINSTGYEVLGTFSANDYTSVTTTKVENIIKGEGENPKYREYFTANKISVDANDYAEKIITVYYYMTQNTESGYQLLELYLDYNKDVFEYVSADNVGATEESFSVKELEDGVIKLSINSSTAITSTSYNSGQAVPLYWVQYKLKKYVPTGDYSLGIEAFSGSATSHSGSYAGLSNSNHAAVTYVGGSVHVENNNRLEVAGTFLSTDYQGDAKKDMVVNTETKPTEGYLKDYALDSLSLNVSDSYNETTKKEIVVYYVVTKNIGLNGLVLELDYDSTVFEYASMSIITTDFFGDTQESEVTGTDVTADKKRIEIDIVGTSNSDAVSYDSTNKKTTNLFKVVYRLKSSLDAAKVGGKYELGFSLDSYAAYQTKNETSGVYELTRTGVDVIPAVVYIRRPASLGSSQNTVKYSATEYTSGSFTADYRYEVKVGTNTKYVDIEGYSSSITTGKWYTDSSGTTVLQKAKANTSPVEYEDTNPIDVKTYYLAVSASQNKEYMAVDTQYLSFTIEEFVVEVTVEAATGSTEIKYSGTSKTWGTDDFVVTIKTTLSDAMKARDFTTGVNNIYSITSVYDTGTTNALTKTEVGEYNADVKVTGGSNFLIKKVTPPATQGGQSTESTGESQTFTVEVTIVSADTNTITSIHNDDDHKDKNYVAYDTLTKYFDNVSVNFALKASFGDVIIVVSKQTGEDTWSEWESYTLTEKDNVASSNVLNAGVYRVGAYVKQSTNYNGVNLKQDTSVKDKVVYLDEFDGTTYKTVTINKIKLSDLVFSYDTDGKVTWTAITTINKTYSNTANLTADYAFPTTITVSYTEKSDTKDSKTTYSAGTGDGKGFSPNATATSYTIVATPSDTTNYTGVELETKAVYKASFAEGSHAEQTTNGVESVAGYEDQYRFKDQKVTKPSDPSVTGYTFTTWNNGTSEYDFTSLVSADLTLTAQWSRNSYTVTYQVAGRQDQTKSFLYNETFVDTDILKTYNGSDTTKKYTFDAWGFGDGTEADGYYPYQYTVTYTSTTKVTENATVVASFTWVWDKFGLEIVVYNEYGKTDADKVKTYSYVYKAASGSDPAVDNRIVAGASIQEIVNSIDTYSWFVLSDLYKTSAQSGDAIRTYSDKLLSNVMPTYEGGGSITIDTKVTLYAYYKFDIGTGDVSADGLITAPLDVATYRKWIVGGYTIEDVESGKEWATVSADNFETTKSSKLFFLQRVADANKDNTRDIRDVTTIRMAITGGYGYYVNTAHNISGSEIETTAYALTVTSAQELSQTLAKDSNATLGDNFTLPNATMLSGSNSVNLNGNTITGENSNGLVVGNGVDQSNIFVTGGTIDAPVKVATNSNLTVANTTLKKAVNLESGTNTVINTGSVLEKSLTTSVDKTDVDVTITGGTFKETVILNAGCIYRITAGTFEKGLICTNGTLIITGGTFSPISGVENTVAIKINLGTNGEANVCESAISGVGDAVIQKADPQTVASVGQDNYTTFKAALAAAKAIAVDSNHAVDLSVTGNTIINEDTVIPQFVTLSVEGSAVLRIKSGSTLTIDGDGALTLQHSTLETTNTSKVRPLVIENGASLVVNGTITSKNTSNDVTNYGSIKLSNTAHYWVNGGSAQSTRWLAPASCSPLFSLGADSYIVQTPNVPYEYQYGFTYTVEGTLTLNADYLAPHVADIFAVKIGNFVSNNHKLLCANPIVYTDGVYNYYVNADATSYGIKDDWTITVNTLADLKNVVQKGGKAVLNADIDLSEIADNDVAPDTYTKTFVRFNKSTVLDLNGHTITGTVKVGTNQTTDVIKATIKNTKSTGMIVGSLAVYGKNTEALIENITTKAPVFGFNTYGADSGSKITVNNSYFEATNASDSFGAYLPAGNVYEFNNCTFKGAAALAIKGGSAELDKCTYIVTADYIPPAQLTGGVIAQGVGVEVQPSPDYSLPIVVTITKPTFTGCNNHKVEFVKYANSEKSKVTVDGITVDAIAAEYKAYAEVSNLSQLQTAIANGGFIRLMANITSSTKLEFNKNTLLELNGKTLSAGIVCGKYTYSTENNQTLKLVVMNGTIHAENCDSNYAIAARNDNKTIEISNVQAYGKYGGMQSYGTARNVEIKAKNSSFIREEAENADPRYDTIGAYLAAGGTYTLDTCTFKGATALGIKGGTTTLNNCTFIATSTYTEPCNAAGFIITSGVGLAVQTSTDYSLPVNVTATNATFTGCDNHKVEFVNYANNQNSSVVVNGENKEAQAAKWTNYHESSTLADLKNYTSTSPDGTYIFVTADLSDNNIAAFKIPNDTYINLNGHTISSMIQIGVYEEGETIGTTDPVSVTFVNGTLDSKAQYYAISIYADNRAAILDNMTLKGYYGGLTVNGMFKNATVTATNSKFCANGQNTANADACVGLYLAGSGNYNFTSCEFTGSMAYAAKSGNHVVKDCTFNVTHEYDQASIKQCGNGIEGKGVAIMLQPTNGYYLPLEFELKGNNTFTGTTEGHKIQLNNFSENTTVTITKNSFTQDATLQNQYTASGNCKIKVAASTN